MKIEPDEVRPYGNLEILKPVAESGIVQNRGQCPVIRRPDQRRYLQTEDGDRKDKERTQGGREVRVVVFLQPRVPGAKGPTDRCEEMIHGFLQ